MVAGRLPLTQIAQCLSDLQLGKKQLSFRILSYELLYRAQHRIYPRFCYGYILI